MRTVDVLSRQEVDRLRNNVTLRIATVLALTGSTLTVDLAGATLIGVPKLASYVPAVSDHAFVLQAGSQILVIGKVG